MKRTLFIVVSICVFILSIALPAVAQEPIDLAIVGGTVLTMDSEAHQIQEGYVAIRKDRIVDVGPKSRLERLYHPRQIINAKGQLAMPGLINTHTHIPMSLFRGIANDLTLQDWLEHYIFPAEARNVTRDFVHWGTLLGALEMIKSGTTTFADMYYFEDEVARSTKQAGLRGVLGETWLDFPAPDNKTFEAMEAFTEKFIQEFKGDPLITPAVAPHAPFTVSPEHLKAARALADKYGVPLLIHVAETKAEEQQIEAKYHARPVQHLKNVGFLEKSVVAAHCVWVNDTDIAILKTFDVGCAHNPSSNMMLASGVAPVVKMLQAGMDVGLGTDGPAGSNNDFDMLEEMDLASKLQKITLMDPKALPARSAVAMATIEGAKVLKLDKEIGSLEKGKRADLIILNLSHPNEVPSYDLYGSLVYSIKGCDVDTTIVNGHILMRHRNVLTLNEPEIIQKAREFHDRILESLKTH
ncbi:MAG: amidohydrolase [Acidobacteriia bacterium]|nr:amidohydrolase [Terriglobia bacterium]